MQLASQSLLETRIRLMLQQKRLPRCRPVPMVHREQTRPVHGFTNPSIRPSPTLQQEEHLKHAQPSTTSVHAMAYSVHLAARWNDYGRLLDY